MKILYKLKDYKETFKFEREHPKELRWDDKYKLYMLTQEDKFQGIWLVDRSEIVAEILFSWESDNVAHIDSFTVLPAFQGKGLGYKIVRAGLEWAKEFGFKHVTGEARKGKSWHIFENLGATPVVLHVNWGGTGEDYMFFKMDL